MPSVSTASISPNLGDRTPSDSVACKQRNSHKCRCVDRGRQMLTSAEPLMNFYERH